MKWTCCLYHVLILWDNSLQCTVHAPHPYLSAPLPTLSWRQLSPPPPFQAVLTDQLAEEVIEYVGVQVSPISHVQAQLIVDLLSQALGQCLNRYSYHYKYIKVLFGVVVSDRILYTRQFYNQLLEARCQSVVQQDGLVRHAIFI